MRIAILDNIHNAYGATSGVHRLRDRAEVQIFTKPLVTRLCSAISMRSSRIEKGTQFTREFLEQRPNLRIIAQTGNHAYHIDLPAAEAGFGDWLPILAAREPRSDNSRPRR